MILSELIPFLKSIEAAPRKALSQNFLIDPNIGQKIIDLAQVKEGDTVLEIGPGPGALTTLLLKTGAKVIAVEMDRAFAKSLSRLQNGKLSIFETDFLKFPMHYLPPNFKVVANLPYHITTPILEKLFAAPFSSLTVMVQKELATRCHAKAGTKDFSSLSLYVQFHSKIHGSFNVSSQSFYPKPKVDSTVIRLDKIPTCATNPFPLIHQGFQKRRKMLSSSLKRPKEKIKEALSSLGIRIDARAEMLTLEEWILLTEKLGDFIL
jgi:16S rRNA (adenine1518-N6/adenine1519-N6)-dimethyltransferase